MDPNHHQRNHLNSRRDTPLTPNVSGNDQTADNLNRNPPDGGNPQATDRQPQYSGGFTMIPPNAAQRSKMKMMAQKEEEELQRLKETHRVTSVHVNPERLGGNVTQAEARQKQFTDFRCSKLQKKLRQEELDRKKRQEEEEKLQKMKAEQREKSERLEERHRQEEQRRREQLSQDHLRTMENFLQRFETRAPVPQASSSGTHMSSRRHTGIKQYRQYPGWGGPRPLCSYLLVRAGAHSSMASCSQLSKRKYKYTEEEASAFSSLVPLPCLLLSVCLSSPFTLLCFLCFLFSFLSLSSSLSARLSWEGLSGRLAEFEVLPRVHTETQHDMIVRSLQRTEQMGRTCTTESTWRKPKLLTSHSHAFSVKGGNHLPSL
ncbi:uncharacterized protein epsti1 isoform X1 [Toxotes jaculatrix]|uniref:uncharacterized protein epsti1 isoform X1 n=1 Tax=Toxotes jaculatrix TaxID=941984 RepID=UPI001B3AD7E5|nr:uncharacterized protein epsti1 isoform X1 [Toxotes jaculatrix]